jgi:D-glycero-D-manno-heptose 1,7-bisphosphate phosphatase
MLKEAARRYDIDLAASVMIGDKQADVSAGQAAGCRTILVRTGYGADDESHVSDTTAVFDDLRVAVESLTRMRNPV